MRPADKAWLALVGGVVAYEVLCPKGELLSEASKRYVSTRPVVTRMFIAFISAHLMHVVPKRYDPLSRLAAAFGR